MSEDEVLMESCDEMNRTLTIKPVARTEVAADAIETSWRLDTGSAVLRCQKYCDWDTDSNKHHGVRHATINTP